MEYRHSYRDVDANNALGTIDRTIQCCQLCGDGDADRSSSSLGSPSYADAKTGRARTKSSRPSASRKVMRFSARGGPMLEKLV